ncbi:MAG: ELM1/GtrOC1 family putative glycosyltransferase [Candidatus Omnitrophota bacterium]|nr:ELM1/GtrOC1 family putative glycosyltransferase [Candidatus Omnitrophota bacterium]
MKQNLIADYLSCALFRVASFFTYLLPLTVSLFIGRRLGDLIYFFDRRHRAVAYANIAKAVADKNDANLTSRITRKAYQAFGQNLIEISIIPRINKEYLNRYIHIENKDYIDAAFKRGKGVIFLTVHGGNWELSNVICATLGFPFVLFIRDQGFAKLNALLNSYRLKLGAKIIHKEAGVRQLIEVLKNNQSIGMMMDQGGKVGELVKFFGKEASMSIGAVKLALKYDCSIIPTFYTRVKGPYAKVILDQVYTVTKTNDPQKDLRDNLQKLTHIYEKYIRQYPHEYLWTYKIFKYGKERKIMILSDGKTGHLRQSESAAKLIIQQLANRGIKTTLNIQEVKFRSSIFRHIFSLLIILSGKYPSHGFLFILRNALTVESWQGLMDYKPDIIISTGGKLSAINYFLSKENQAKSVVLMRSVLSDLKKFDLKIIPKHDRPQGRSLVSSTIITEGALNLVDPNYLNEKSERLRKSGLIKGALSSLAIGVLIGGDSKGFSISIEAITQVILQLKKIAEELDADILLSTSRRTTGRIEKVIKSQLADYPRCKLLVIANENNHADVVGGILGISNIIISSPESISMVSEAVASGKYVFVFKIGRLSRKHRYFLRNYQNKGYIYLKAIQDLAFSMKEIWRNKPEIILPKDNLKAVEGLNKIL